LISASAQATSTGPIAAASARRSTCTIIGCPAISASGLPGSRRAAMRAGITTIGRKLGKGTLKDLLFSARPNAPLRRYAARKPG
jgi:hypothetical protein